MIMMENLACDAVGVGFGYTKDGRLQIGSVGLRWAFIGLLLDSTPIIQDRWNLGFLSICLLLRRWRVG